MAVMPLLTSSSQSQSLMRLSTSHTLWLRGKYRDSLSATVAVAALGVQLQRSVQETAVWEQMMDYHFLMVAAVRLV